MQIEVNGIHLWFDVDGPLLVPDGAEMRERPTVVLLHGGPGGFDHSYFKPDFERLAREAQVVYLDLRGHGRSTHGDTAEWGFEICADDVRAFCDQLGIVRPVIYGHSLGGYVAMVYGARHPGHARGLVLQSTTARFDLRRIVDEFHAIGGDEVAEIVERTYTNDPTVTREEWARCWALFGPWVPGETEKARTVVHLELNAPGKDLMRGFDVRSDLAGVTSPTLVSVGELDPITPVAAAQEIVDALPAGVGHLDVIEGAGHFPWRDAPERYWRGLSDFLDAVARPS